MNREKSGIYKILNKVNGKFYIGSAVYFYDRWHTHKYHLRRNQHKNRYLQSAWNKHGEYNFEFIKLEIVNDLTKLLEIEQRWINETICYNREIGYNLFEIAGSPLGHKQTEEHKAKILASRKGFKHSEDSKAKMRIVQSNKSEQHKKNISLSKIGHVVSNETKKKIGDANRGRTRNRRYDKYPHELASKCKCVDCRKTRSEDLKAWRHNKNKSQVQHV